MVRPGARVPRGRVNKYKNAPQHRRGLAAGSAQPRVHYRNPPRQPPSFRWRSGMGQVPGTTFGPSPTSPTDITAPEDLPPPEAVSLMTQQVRDQWLAEALTSFLNLAGTTGIYLPLSSLHGTWVGVDGGGAYAYTQPEDWWTRFLAERSGPLQGVEEWKSRFRSNQHMFDRSAAMERAKSFMELERRLRSLADNTWPQVSQQYAQLATQMSPTDAMAQAKLMWDTTVTQMLGELQAFWTGEFVALALMRVEQCYSEFQRQVAEGTFGSYTDGAGVTHMVDLLPPEQRQLIDARLAQLGETIAALNVNGATPELLWAALQQCEQFATEFGATLPAWTFEQERQLKQAAAQAMLASMQIEAHGPFNYAGPWVPEAEVAFSIAKAQLHQFLQSFAQTVETRPEDLYNIVNGKAVPTTLLTGELIPTFQSIIATMMEGIPAEVMNAVRQTALAKVQQLLDTYNDIQVFQGQFADFASGTAARDDFLARLNQVVYILSNHPLYYVREIRGSSAYFSEEWVGVEQELAALAGVVRQYMAAAPDVAAPAETGVTQPPTAVEEDGVAVPDMMVSEDAAIEAPPTYEVPAFVQTPPPPGYDRVRTGWDKTRNWMALIALFWAISRFGKGMVSTAAYARDRWRAR